MLSVLILISFNFASLMNRSLTISAVSTALLIALPRATPYQRKKTSQKEDKSVEPKKIKKMSY